MKSCDAVTPPEGGAVVPQIDTASPANLKVGEAYPSGQR